MSTKPQQKKKPRIYTTSFVSVYPHYVAKAEKKGRTQAEVDIIIRWLTGYTEQEFQSQLDKETDFETFFSEAPKLNPNRSLITGSEQLRVAPPSRPTEHPHIRQHDRP
jgi:hypothetical protein